MEQIDKGLVTEEDHPISCIGQQKFLFCLFVFQKSPIDVMSQFFNPTLSHIITNV